MHKKFWKIQDKNDRYNYRKQLKFLRRKNRKKNNSKKKNTVIIEKMYNSRFDDFIDYSLIKESFLDGRIYSIMAPSIFSLKKNYNESMRFICHIASLLNSFILRKANLIYLNLKNCKIYDLDASCILDSIMYELKNILKKHNINFKVDFPKDVKSLAYLNIITTGFVNDSGWITNKIPTQKIREQMKTSNNVKFVDFKKNSIINNDVITTEVVEMIFSNFKNKAEYIRPMGKIISEIVDNVKEHSNNNSWYIVGNMIPKNEYNKSSIRLAILNYGKTISKNLEDFMNNDNPLITEYQRKIINNSKEIIKKYRILLPDEYYESEQAYTYLAMQQGISSKVIEENNLNRRGSGIYKLNKEIVNISNCSNLSNSNLTVISGKTMIDFKNKYRYKKNNEIDNNLFQINFNEKNTIFDVQDSNCIVKLKYNIPGTIIYLDFDFKEELIND